MAVDPLTQEDRTAHVGMVLFLASWAMMFAALFAACAFVRARAMSWPPVGFPPLPKNLALFSTALIACSSVALELERRRRPLIALLFGLAFLASQTHLGLTLVRGGVDLASSGSYGGALYGLCGFHALHVAVGLMGLGFLCARPSPLARSLWSAFWHFVGVVWLALFFVAF